MKKNIAFYIFAFVFVFSNILWAQGSKPLLKNIKFFNVYGVQLDTTANGQITVQLKFDRPMDQQLNPNVEFGLSAPYNLTLPTGEGWIADTLWQGTLNVNEDTPPTADGKYTFQVSGAQDTNSVVMDDTLSSDFGKSLYICRSGSLYLNGTTALNFGTIQAGTIKTLPLTIYNTSCAKLNVTNITFPGNSPFKITSPSSSSFTINGTSNQVMFIGFMTNERNSFSKTMTIVTDHSSHEVQLSGTTKGSYVTLNPSYELDFGKVEVGSSDTLKVRVTNESANDPALSETLNVTNITVSTYGSVYSVNPTSLTIAPGFTDSVSVIFKPTEDKDYSGSVLLFYSNDAANSPTPIILNGDASDESPPGSLSNLQFSWNGTYSHFTSSDFLNICWDNPNDPSGIAAVWWYFTSSYINPKNSLAPDTTKTIAGRISLQGNAHCINFPLFSKITSGFWYCYFWLEDSKGNKSWSDAAYQSFTYDRNPPGIPGLLYRQITERTWFGVNDKFRILLNIPEDEERNIKDAAKVFWKFKALPTVYSHVLQNTANDTFRIEFLSNSLCGDDSLYIWLSDSTGNVNENNSLGVRFRFDNCPPVITRVLPDSIYANLGQDFPDTLLITDDVGVDTVWVRYRFGGAKLEEPRKAVNRIAGTDNFKVVLPDAGVTRRGIEYKITAVDSFGIKGEGPVRSSYCDNDDYWFPVRTRVERAFRIDSDGAPIPLISGEDETNYQLFSVPYVLDSSKVMEVLEDDLGLYDPTLWRLFDYDTENARFLEGDTARAITPGRSYFIISRYEKFVDSGPGLTHRTVCNDTLRVYEGWNLIATPFNFPIAQNSLSLINADTSIVELLHSYELGWNHSEVMESWKGYAIYVTKASGQSAEIPIYLVVEPKAAIGTLAKTTSNYPSLQPGDWLIQISAKAGRIHDLNNWVGIQSSAKPGFDKLELAEPPVIGKYIKLSFSHPEWNQPAKEFSTDIRPFDIDEQVWEFDVDTNQPYTTVNLTFDFLGEFPGDAEIHLIDEALKLAQNLRAKSEYSFNAGKDGSTKRLKLIVGSREFASEQAGEIALIPEKFELLQNFPNPFNPETSIRYNLPEAAQVKLVVYNLLGRQVRVLINNDRQNAGYYTIAWNGKDDTGRQLASGVYIYRLLANSQSMTRKMLLMK